MVERVAARERARIREAVRAELSRAIADVDHHRRIVTNPYAGHEAYDALNTARGIAQGLGRAIDTIDRGPKTVP
jgi:hypothetical protein